MSKRSDSNTPTGRETKETTPRPGRMLSWQSDRKFVSDEDILGRQDWLKQSRPRMKHDENKFVSDEDIVQRRVA
jgi:hypothetical protein